MAVELFNLNYYIAEASASNPDEAVILTHTDGYTINAAPADRIFVQSTGRTVISGGLVHPTAIASSIFCAVTGPSPNRNQLVISGMRLFDIRGGGQITQSKVFSQGMTLHAITS